MQEDNVIVLDEEAWQKFLELLDREPQVKPRLRELFLRGSVFDEETSS